MKNVLNRKPAPQHNLQMDSTLERRVDRRRFVSDLGRSMSLLAVAPSIHALYAQELPSGGHIPGTWNPMDFGAKGDGRSKDTLALQHTMDHCAAAGGGTVVLPSGHTFLSGTLSLPSHVELHLAGGSILRASPDRDDFRDLGSLLFAKDAEGVHISGTGMIDGNFKAFFGPKGPGGYTIPQPFLGPYDPLYDETYRNPKDGRPRMLLLVNCRRVLLEDFTIRDSPTWTIHPIGCEDLHIFGISILNDLDVPNCDGIDIDHCRRVRIDGCNIVAGDDCLIIKASRNFGEYGPTEGVTITNCTLESSSAAIKVETEGPYPVRSVIVSDCSIVRSNRGVSFLNRDGAMVEDFLFTNLVIETRMRSLMWWGSGEPVSVSSLPRKKGGPPGQIRNVHFSNLQCRGESGIYLRGSQGAPLQDITFSDIDLVIEKTTTIPGGFYDLRPGDTFGEAGLERRRIAGILATDVTGLRLQGLHVSWSGPAPTYFGAALELHQCDAVSLNAVTGAAAHPGEIAAVFDQVKFIKEISLL